MPKFAMGNNSKNTHNKITSNKSDCSFIAEGILMPPP